MDDWASMRKWDLVLPPSRPSAHQLAALRLQIRFVDRAQPVAILGSTPEFRDLLYECGFSDVYLLERNPTFLSAMSDLRVYASPETIIQGDWLDTLPDSPGRFALILSDLTSGNIPYDDRPRFYDYISNALMPGGLFCDKILTHPSPHIPIDSLVRKYSELPLNLLHINHFSSEMLFCSEFLDHSQTVDSTLFYRMLEERIQNPRVRAFAAKAKSITPPGFIWWYGRPWSELRHSYCPILRVYNETGDEAGSPYFGRLKHFVLIKSDASTP